MEIISAFALCDFNAGENKVKWKKQKANVLYLDRFGVNVKYLREGIGSLMLTKAKETAKANGAESLRLFVVDINKPAINLYTKNGFIKAEGVDDEVIDEDFILHEFGFEAEII